MAIHDAAMSFGIMLYPGTGCADGLLGDQVLIAPPYTITKDEVDVIVDGTLKAIQTVLGE